MRSNAFSLGIFLSVLSALSVDAATLNVTDDTYTNPTWPRSKHGDGLVVNVGDRSPEHGPLTTYARFDLSVLGNDVGSADVVKASLRIFVSELRRAGTLHVHLAQGEWDEVTLNANRAPGHDPLPISSVELDSSHENGFVTLDVTDAVRGWLVEPAANNGLVLSPEQLRVSLDTKENTFTGQPMEIEVVLANGGSPGPEGEPGLKGDKGDPGSPGANGTSCRVSPAPGGATVACTDGTSATISDGAPGLAGSPDTPEQVLVKLQGVDGGGSGLDADLLDGLDSTDFVSARGGSVGDLVVEGALTANRGVTFPDGTTQTSAATGGATAISNVVLVASAGGDFTSIQAALDAIIPTVDTPYVIKVAPGSYPELITMKSYVRLVGAGRDSTEIVSPPQVFQECGARVVMICLEQVTAAEFAGFTVSGLPAGVEVGISMLQSSAIVIRDNRFMDVPNGGVLSEQSEDLRIARNEFFSGAPAINLDNLPGASASLLDNLVTVAGIDGRGDLQMIGNRLIDADNNGSVSFRWVGSGSVVGNQFVMPGGNFSWEDGPASISANRITVIDVLIVEGQGPFQLTGNDIVGTVLADGPATIVGNTIRDSSRAIIANNPAVTIVGNRILVPTNDPITGAFLSTVFANSFSDGEMVGNVLRSSGPITLESENDVVTIKAGDSEITLGQRGISLSTDGDLNLRAGGRLNLEAADTNIRVLDAMTINSGGDTVINTNADLEITAGGTTMVSSTVTAIESGVSTSIRAGGLVEVEAGGSININAPVVNTP